MNRSVRAVGIGVAAAFAVLAVVTAWQQAVAGPRYRDDLRNPRGFAAIEDRGDILAVDGTPVAVSLEGERRYRSADLYAHPVGYASKVFGAVGLEGSRTSDLKPPPGGTVESLVLRLLGEGNAPSDLILTLDPAIQQAALDGLGSQRGAVVAVDVQTGAVLAWASTPTFDPNDLVGDLALSAGEALSNRDDGPLLDRVRSALYPPGSTFKVLVAAAALEAGLTADTALEDTPSYLAPGTEVPIENFEPGRCGSGSTISLADALRVSCNTAFAALGVDMGAEALTSITDAAGFDADLPVELVTARSSIPSSDDLDADLPALAQSAIGGRDVRVTPLHMALIAAAVANDGLAPRVRLVDAVVDSDGVTTPGAGTWRRVFSEATADTLRSMMIDVVEEGTGTAAAISGVVVGGKTGTADVPDGPAHAWFISFAELDGKAVAVAVVVENGGDLGEAGTGGRVAAPIARSVIEAWVASSS